MIFEAGRYAFAPFFLQKSKEDRRSVDAKAFDSSPLFYKNSLCEKGMRL